MVDSRDTEPADVEQVDTEGQLYYQCKLILILEKLKC